MFVLRYVIIFFSSSQPMAKFIPVHYNEWINEHKHWLDTPKLDTPPPPLPPAMGGFEERLLCGSKRTNPHRASQYSVHSSSIDDFNLIKEATRLFIDPLMHLKLKYKHRFFTRAMLLRFGYMSTSYHVISISSLYCLICTFSL